MTIEQIQSLITNKGDLREITNELADYIQTNPSSPGGSSYLLSQTFGGLTLTSLGSTRYAIFGLATVSTLEAARQTIIPVSGNITAFYVRAANEVLNAGQITFKLKINGVDIDDSVISFSLGDTSITTNSSSFSQPVTAGDLISISIINDTGSGVGLYSVAIKIT